MNRPQIRNLKEWNAWCILKGTSGDQVFDILEDWEIENQQLQDRIKELEAKLEEAKRLLQRYCWSPPGIKKDSILEEEINTFLFPAVPKPESAESKKQGG